MIRLDEARTIARVFDLSVDQMLSDEDLTDKTKQLEHLDQLIVAASAQLSEVEAFQQRANKRLHELKMLRRAVEQGMTDSGEVPGILVRLGIDGSPPPPFGVL
jgi:hypothetical protein